MKFKKRTHGVVVQEFEVNDAGEPICVGQQFLPDKCPSPEFLSEDGRSLWLTELDEVVELDKLLTDYEVSFPLDMVQPTPVVKP
jgi:hypothetical protein